MRKTMSLSIILILIVSLLRIPVSADSFVVSWNAYSSNAVYQNGIDSGYDWYFYNNGSAEYNLDIPVNGIYSMKITKHNITDNTVFTVTKSGEILTKDWVTDDKKDNFIISDNIYLNAGSQKVTFATSHGGAVRGFELTLLREETRVYKSVKEWNSQPTGASNGDNWYFYNDSVATYDFAVPENGKYKILLNYSGKPENDTSYVTYLGRKYPCKPGQGTEENTELISDIILYKRDGKISISGFGNCTVSGITIILTEVVDNIELTATDLANASAGTAGNGNIENIIDRDSGSSYVYNLNPSITEATMEDFWIQISLDAPHKINQIRYLHDINHGTWDHFTKYISFRLSNDPEFKTYTEITYSDVIPNNGEYFTLPVNENEAYRYIRLQKMDPYNFALACAELEVWGAEERDESYGIFAKNIEFHDSEGNVNSEMKVENTTSVSANIINNTVLDSKIIVACACYDEGNLISVQLSSENVPNKSEKSILLNDIEFERWERGNIIKTFIWTDENTPLFGAKPYLVSFSEIYISLNGNDSATGTLSAPYKTLERAKQEVRKFNDNMTEDINVYIMGGTYSQKETLVFTDEDSGTNGNFVNWTAYNGNPVLISGGDEIDNWELYNDKIYRAKYITDKPVRQLCVNGRNAVRAKSSSMCKINGVIDNKIVIDDEKFSQYKNKQDMQLHFSSGWKSYLMNVEDITESDGQSLFEITEYAINKAVSNVQHHMYNQHHMWIENAFEELDEEGEFYYDRKEQMIYYIPRPDDDMTNITAQAAVLEKLIDIYGSDANNKVKNICFDNLTFAHSTWYQPAQNGLLTDQAQMIVPDNNQTERKWNDLMVNNSGISLNFAENISIKNNIIKDMGAVGIGMYQGVYNCEISNNTFYDIADSAITVGTVNQEVEDILYQGKNLVENKVLNTSSFTGENYPELAIDCNTNSVWSPRDEACWWQIDLEDAYKIDRIEIDSRTDNGKTVLQRDLIGVHILGSNTNDFSEYTELAVVSNQTPVSDQTYVIGLSNDMPYRYIRLIKDSYMCLANIRIINESMEYAPVVQTCKNNMIKNNYITHIGLVNYGAPAIQGYYTSGLTIRNNEIYDVPYSGICVGWGWNQNKYSTTCYSNSIINNKITNCMQMSFDGGGIYLLGQQPNSIVCGNYISGQTNHLAAIYLDSGTQGYTIYNNALEDIPYSIFVSKDTDVCSIYDNYSTSVLAFNESKNNVSMEEAVVFALGAMPHEAKTIADNSGLAENEDNIKLKAGDSYQLYSGENRFYSAMDNREEAGYMNDEYFAYNWLGIYLDAADKWIELSSGMGHDELLLQYSEEIGHLRDEMNCNILNREKILLLYKEFRIVAEAIKNLNN